MEKVKSTYLVLDKNQQASSKLNDYYLLVKFKLTLMVVISSILAYLVAAGSNLELATLFLLVVGGFLITAASNALNQVLERDFDKLMVRTQDRPLAARRMKVSEAVLFAGFALLTGISALAIINPLSALLGTISFVAYAFIYTPLKRYSTIAVALGAIPGAFPVMIGVVAFEGSLTLLALVLFGIQFLWQFPHFWSIGWLSFEDYNRAGFKLLPTDENGDIDKSIGLHSFLYAILLLPLLAIAVYNGLEISNLSIIFIVIMNLVYIGFSFQFFRLLNRKSALALMFCSFFYLPIVLISFLLN